MIAVELIYLLLEIGNTAQIILSYFVHLAQPRRLFNPIRHSIHPTLSITPDPSDLLINLSDSAHRTESTLNHLT